MKFDQYANDLGQLVRVEVHGKLTQQLSNMKAIFEQVIEKSVKMCWNCNDEDLINIFIVDTMVYK